MTTNQTSKDDIPRPMIMAVRAHPDDECFTVGGTLARYSSQGDATVLVICTGGENGEIVDEELNTPENRERLAEIRARELHESCSILGVKNIEMLGYRDSGMAGTPENEDPRSFNKSDFDEAVGRLVRLVRQYKPDVLITDNEEGSYGHPDHIMCNKVTVGAYEAASNRDYRPDIGEPYQVAKLYYTAFARFQIVGTWRKMRELGLEMPWRREEEDADTEPTWGLPDDELDALIDIRAELKKKLASLLAHRSQIKPDMWMLTLPPDVFEGFLGYEAFQRIKSTVENRGQEDDLFAGLRQPVGVA